MNINITAKYLGDLRVESKHLKSNTTIITDAPIDNFGKGESFSPTDLLCSSLASCMITIMGIKANQNNLNIENLNCDIEKIMTKNLPRKISEIVINFNFSTNNFSQDQKNLLIDSALNCPVALSIASDIKKTINFNF
jgi:uncharacterized OsmC-like protein